nr:reverse transcriptase domain-containing protein [Tanacetum cinerariifolium]
PYEAFACRCGAGDVVLRESYKPKTRGKLYYACPLSKNLPQPPPPPPQNPLPPPSPPLTIEPTTLTTTTHTSTLPPPPPPPPLNHNSFLNPLNDNSSTSFSNHLIVGGDIHFIVADTTAETEGARTSRERAESTTEVMVIDKSRTYLGRHEKAFFTGLKKFIKHCKPLFKAWQLNVHKKNSSISSKPDRAHICTISGAIRGTAIIMPTTTTMFAATTPKNTPLAYRVSTSTNLNPVISPTFVEANYETLESLRDRRRQMRNNDLRTELEYFSKDYNEEIEMKPRPRPVRAVTPPLRAASPRVRRRREIVVGFEETQNRAESRVERNNEGGRPSEEEPIGNGSQNVNLPTLLAAHIWRSENGRLLQFSLTFVYGAHRLPSTNSDGKPIYEGKLRQPPIRRAFTIDLPKRQQKKFTKTHLAMHNIKQRENESTRAFITRNTDDTLQILGLHEDQRIFNFIHGLKTRSLVEHFSTDLSLTYKGLMEKNYTWVEAREVATNGVSSDRRDSFENHRKTKTGSPPIEDQTTVGSPICPKVQEKFLPLKEPQKASNHLLICLEANDRGIPPSIKKEKAKSTDTPRGEGKKYKSTTLVEAPILMINIEDYATKNTVSKSMAYKEGITFPLVTRVSNAPVIIEAAVFERKVGRVYMDNGSTCERVKEKEVSDPSNEWKLYTDGASSSNGAGAGLMLIDPVEYEALLGGLRIAQEMEITKVAIFLDSQLVVNQIKGTYAAKQLSIKSYFQKTDKIIKEIHEGFCGFNAEPRLMVVRITKQGYYWPSMHREAAKIIQDYDKCKEQSAIRKSGMNEAITVRSTWPFSLLGIHILGPLPMAPGGGGMGFKAGVEDGVASWEEGTCIWVLEGIGFCKVGGFFDSKASTEAEASATYSFNQENMAVARLFKAWQLNVHKKNSSISSKPDRAHICTISGAIHGTATIMPTTTTMFAATTPENTPLAYRVSTSINPNHDISPTFVEANYETLESLRDRRRQMRNNDLRTELEYFSKDYDEEREMKPRPRPARPVTPPLQSASPRVRKRREIVVGFEETQNRGKSRVKRNNEGGRPSKEAPIRNGSQNALSNNIGGNLPPNDLPLTYKGLMEKTYTWFKAREVATNGISSDQRDSFENHRKKTGSPPIEDQTTVCSPICPKVQEKFLPLKEPQKASNHLPRCLEANDHEIPPSKKDKSTTLVEAPILMINIEDYAAKNTISESMAYKEGITFPLVTRVSNAPVIIEAAVFEKKVKRVYMDNGSTCEVIYEHCFEKPNPTIKATRVNTETPLVGFSGKRSWSIGEVSLEITIGEHPFSRTKTLNLVIVKSDSSHNMLLGRTSMQKMGIVVSTIHEAYSFTPKKESKLYSRLAKLGKKQRRLEGPLPFAKKGYQL